MSIDTAAGNALPCCDTPNANYLKTKDLQSRAHANPLYMLCQLYRDMGRELASHMQRGDAHL